MWPCLTGTVLEKQGCPLAVEGWLLSSGAGVLGLRIRRSPGLAQQEPCGRPSGSPCLQARSQEPEPA